MVGTALNAPVVGMAADLRRRRLLAAGIGRRHLHLRRRAVPRLHGRPPPQRADGRHRRGLSACGAGGSGGRGRTPATAGPPTRRAPRPDPPRIPPPGVRLERSYGLRLRQDRGLSCARREPRPRRTGPAGTGRSPGWGEAPREGRLDDRQHRRVRAAGHQPSRARVPRHGADGRLLHQRARHAAGQDDRAAGRDGPALLLRLRRRRLPRLLLVPERPGRRSRASAPRRPGPTRATSRAPSGP